MTENTTSLATVYQDWDTYQQLLLQAVAPLSDEPLAFHAAPHVRSIRDLIAHMIGMHARWFHSVLGEGADVRW
jgi:uncharacterized damage-inducible protein DinB